jgi:hypothetical protein
VSRPVGGEDLRGEEVGGDEGVLVGGDEVGPADLGLPAGRVLEAVAAQDVRDGLVADLEAQVVQSAGEAVVAPARIIPGEAQDELFELGIEERAASSRAAPFTAIELGGDEAAVPGEDGLGLDDGGDVREGLLTELVAELGEQAPLVVGERHPAGQLAAEDLVLGGQVLVAQEQLLFDVATDEGERFDRLHGTQTSEAAR